MARKKVSITEIADELRIAPSTVSRALNDLPGVSDELREAIRSKALELGYKKVKSAAVTNEKLNIIAMIVGDIRNPFYADLVFNVQRHLNNAGYLLCVFNSEYNEQEEIRYMHLAERFNFAGIIQITVTTENVSTLLKNLSIPVVMVNRMINSFDTDTVLMDNYEAGYIVTRFLVELGHSRIGFLLGQQNSSSSGMRFEGYEQAMHNYGLTVNPEDIIQGDLKMETAYELAKTFIESHDELPTAMIVSNDLSALGFMTRCEEMGISIPNDMSIVSFDNIRFASAGVTPLTTVDPQVAEMGRIAAEVIVERIQHPNREKQRIILKPTLIVRKSATECRKKNRDT